MNKAHNNKHSRINFSLPRDTRALWVGLLLSVVCIGFFSYDVLIDLFLGEDATNTHFHTILEVLVVLAAVAAFLVHARELQRFSVRHRRLSVQMRVASGDFAAVVEELFCEWGLTPAERSVAIYLIKGLSLADIADLRGAKVGTVKAQSNAIYQKAAVHGRQELLACLLDELLDGLAP